MPAENIPTIPPEWLPGITALQNLPPGGAALLIGAPDRGKTTFVALAAQSLATAYKTAIVDADIGQSEIGAPGTVGAAWADTDTPRLHELKPFAAFFVGSFTPQGVMLEHVSGVRRAVDTAAALNADRILVDTTGLVAGEMGRRLKAAKAQAVLPNLIIALSRGDELGSLLAAVQAATGARVLILPSPDTIPLKSARLRQMRRTSRLSQALEGSRTIALPLATVATVGATLGTGSPIAPHLCEWASGILRQSVVWGELDSSANLTLFLGGGKLPAEPAADGAIIARYFRAKLVRFLLLSAYTNVYMGLQDGAGKLLAVGRFVSLDTERGEMHIAAPPPATPERVRLVQFGRARIAADGKGIAAVRYGEI